MNRLDESKLAKRQVQRFIERLQKQRDSAVKSDLANLRRGLGHHPAEIPELWGSLFGDLYTDDDTKHFFQRDGVTQLEWAIYTTLTLFALHQQSLDISNNSMNGKASLGKAVRLLSERRCGESNASSKQDPEEMQTAVWRRFARVIKAPNMESVAYHLRNIVTLLRANKIGFDYPQLSQDLYWFQIPSYRHEVCMRWGRDFHSFVKSDEDEQSSKK